jgi:hypothetical protein
MRSAARHAAAGPPASGARLRAARVVPQRRASLCGRTWASVLLPVAGRMQARVRGRASLAARIRGVPWAGPGTLVPQRLRARGSRRTTPAQRATSAMHRPEILGPVLSAGRALAPRAAPPDSSALAQPGSAGLAGRAVPERRPAHVRPVRGVPMLPELARAELAPAKSGLAKSGPVRPAPRLPGPAGWPHLAQCRREWRWAGGLAVACAGAAAAEPESNSHQGSGSAIPPSADRQAAFPSARGPRWSSVLARAPA